MKLFVLSVFFFSFQAQALTIELKRDLVLEPMRGNYVQYVGFAEAKPGVPMDDDPVWGCGVFVMTRSAKVFKAGKYRVEDDIERAPDQHLPYWHRSLDSNVSTYPYIKVACKRVPGFLVRGIPNSHINKLMKGFVSVQ